MHHIKRWAHYNLLSERVSRRNALIFKVYEHEFFFIGKVGKSCFFAGIQP